MMQLRGFVIQALERAGGVVEPRGARLWDALLPPFLESAMEGRSVVTLAFESDALLDQPDADLVTLDSPLVEGLFAFARQVGTTSTGHLAVEHPRGKRLAEKVTNSLIFSHCRAHCTDGDAEVRLAWYAQFNFSVAYVSDGVREMLYVVPVNLWSNQANWDLAERLAGLPVVSETPEGIPETPRVPLKTAYATAQSVLREVVAAEALRQQQQKASELTTQFEHIREPFSQKIARLQKRQEKQTEEAQKEKLSRKVEALRTEEERRLQELAKKHRLETRASLVSARLLSQPKTFFDLQLDRGAATRTLALAYDPLLERVEPPGCEGCRRETTRIHFTESSKLLCDACASR